MRTQKLFTLQQQKDIEVAIKQAELQTSGEIRLFIENHCRSEVLDRAVAVFEKLTMHQTKQRNGVLFYVAAKDRQLAILGDAGINAVVQLGFWDTIKEKMILRFKEDQYTEGLCEGITMTGEALKTYFPYGKGDKNELSDTIVFGKDV